MIKGVMKTLMLLLVGEKNLYLLVKERGLFKICENAEMQIQQTMYARISRIVLGTGATIADLLVEPNGRFTDVFQTVVFAILGKETEIVSRRQTSILSLWEC